MSLSKRIASIEAQAAPALERARKRKALLAHFFSHTKADFNESAEVARYTGRDVTIEQVKSEWGEFFLLSLAECQWRFKSIKRLSPEQATEAMVYASMRLTRDWYGRELNFDEALREQEMAEQVWADFREGKPSNESEAAQYFISLFARHPRLKQQSDEMAAYMAGADMDAWRERRKTIEP